MPLFLSASGESEATPPIADQVTIKAKVLQFLLL